MSILSVRTPYILLRRSLYTTITYKNYLKRQNNDSYYVNFNIIFSFSTSTLVHLCDFFFKSKMCHVHWFDLNPSWNEEHNKQRKSFFSGQIFYSLLKNIHIIKHILSDWNLNENAISWNNFFAWNFFFFNNIGINWLKP